MKPRILVVDDEPSLRTVLSANLKQEGYNTVLAEDGAKAKEQDGIDRDTESSGRD